MDMRDTSTTSTTSHCLQLKLFVTYATHIIKFDLFTTIGTLTPTISAYSRHSII